jgi:2-keto-4-pentenoate hydratase
MLNDNQIHGASDLLFHHWQDGRCLTALPQRMRPSTRAEGYAIQALLDHRTNEPLFGWKIAATSLAGQVHIGVDGPLAGRLLREKVFSDGAHLSLPGSRMRVAEPEIAGILPTAAFLTVFASGHLRLVTATAVAAAAPRRSAGQHSA